MAKISDDRVKILSENVVFDNFFRIKKAQLRHKLFNGKMSEELTRLSFERGDSAAVIMHSLPDDSIILTEQFRYPTYGKNSGWILEIPAGSVEADEVADPTKTMRREILEEIGYSATQQFHKICTFYVSPGGTSERIHLYYTRVTPKDKVARGGGVMHEGEDIRVLSIKVDDALRMVEQGKLLDAKSIIALQWLQINRSRLKR